MEREKFDEIHEIYIRMTEIWEAILAHPDFPSVATDPSAGPGELLGQCTAVGQEAAKLKILTAQLATSNPDLYKIWLDALAKKE